MSKARSTGNIGNIIKTSATCVTVNDGTTDLLIMSGSGRVTIPGNLVVLGGISGSSAESSSYSLSSSFATNANTLDGIDGASFLQTGSFNTFSSSIDTTIKNKLNGDGVISGSVQVDITNTTGYSTFSSSLSSSIGSLSGSVATTTSGLSSSIGSLSSSVATNTSGLASRIGSVETKTGSYATTGSNVFIGSQVITGSLYITNDMIVQGCSCLQNITASAVSIGTNVVMLNTATPAVRFAGISVQDSGSNAGVTGSIYWDGLCNKWIYSNPSDIGYSGGMLISGPRSSTLGSEAPLTCNYIAKSGGGDHIYDSCIVDDGTSVCVKGSLVTTGVFTVISEAGSTSMVLGQVATTNPKQLLISNVTGSNYIRFQGIQQGIGYNQNIIFQDGGGYVGIGTNCPTGYLHISAATPGQNEPNIRLTDSSTAGNGGNVYISADKAGVGYNNLTMLAFSYTFKGGASATNYLTIDTTGVSCFAGAICAPTIQSANICTDGSYGSRVVAYGSNVGMFVNSTGAGEGYYRILNGACSIGALAATGWYKGSAEQNMGIITGPSKSFQIATNDCANARLTIGADGISVFACQVCMPATAIISGGGNTLTLKKGTGSAALTFAGTSDEATFLVEGISGGGMRWYTSPAGCVLSNAAWNSKFNIDVNGISTFSCTVCAPALVSTGGISLHGNVKTFALTKYFNERESGTGFFKIYNPGGNGFSAVIHLMSQNPSVGWSQAQVYQAVSAPYWGGWVGSTGQVSLIGSSSGYISSAAVSNNGCISFYVTTGNNGTNTTMPIVAYIQITSFDPSSITVTAL